MNTTNPSKKASETPGDDEAVIDLDNFLPYRLNRISQLISRGIAAGYQDYGLSVNEWRVMAVLAMHPNYSASQLCDYTAMDKVTIHRAVSLLCDKDLLQRNTNPDDKRQQSLRLSRHGQRLYLQICPHVQAYEQNLLSSLNSSDLDNLLAVLKKLESSL